MELEVSAEVAELVGAENLRLLEAQAAGGYTCTVCDRAAAGDCPASVVVLQEEMLTAVELAHAGCVRSRVVEVEPGTLRVADETPATAVVAVLPSASELGMRPVVLLELSETLDLAAGGGDRVDGVITRMIGQGLGLVDRVGRTAPVAAGWSVTLLGEDGLRVEGPGEVVYDGQAWRPDGWEQLVAAVGGRCEVFVGVGLGLAEGLADVGEGMRRLRTASRAGLLVGGSVPVRAG